MELYLLRHGIAEDAQPGEPDSGRALTSEGKKKLRLVLNTAKDAGVSPDLILTSPYKRAVQTAQIAAEVLKYRGELMHTDALLPSSRCENAWEEIRLHKSESQLLLAGHDPQFPALAAYLLGFPDIRVDFKKGALLRVDFDKFPAEPHGTLRWFLVPRLTGA